MSSHFVLAEPATLTVVTPAFALVIDRKTLKVVKVQGEKTPPGGWAQYAEAAAAGTELLHSTEGIKGAEELQGQTAKFLLSVAAAVTTQVSTKM